MLDAIKEIVVNAGGATTDKVNWPVAVTFKESVTVTVKVSAENSSVGCPLNTPVVALNTTPAGNVLSNVNV